MKHGNFKRTVCSLLAFVMLFSLMPAAALADYTGGLCPHHTEHADCGWSEGSEAVPCSHVCDEACFLTETLCVHTCDGSCGYDEAVEGSVCDHVCSVESGCVITVPACVHTEHDGSCGYAEAVPATGCGFFCDICSAPAEPEEQLPEETPEQLPETEAEDELFYVSAWSWADAAVTDGCLTLEGEAPMSLDAVIAALPAAVSTEFGPLALEWSCGAYPAEGASEGSFEFDALLPVGYVLADEALPLVLTVVIDTDGLDTAASGSGAPDYDGDLGLPDYVAPPTITSHPTSVSVTAGSGVYLNVSATGQGLGFQWQVKPAGGSNWINSGAASAMTPALYLEPTASMNGHQYRCRVNNSAGEVYSDVATVTVLSKPAITKQPTSVTTPAGGTARFTVTATGGALSYQWQVQAPGSTGWANSGISSAKTATLSLTVNSSHNGYKYRCVVKNSLGTATSNAATLTVGAPLTPPVITAQPKSVTANAGTAISLSVTASGSDISYQWQVKAPGGSWVNSGISSAETRTLSFTAGASHNGYQYRCIVKNSGGSVTSSVVTLTISAPPVITQQPANSPSAAVGNTVTMSVTASGTNLSYQWQVQAPGSSTWANSSITSAKTRTLSFTVNSSHNAYRYRCRVSNSAGTVYSNAVVLTVVNAVQPPQIHSNPANVSSYIGKSVSFSVSASGTGLTYQWQALKPGASAWVNSGVASAKTATLTVSASASMNGYKYRCMVKNSGGTVYSAYASLTVIPKPVITSNPIPVAVYAGNNVSFSVGASGTGTLTYQWQALKPGASAWVNSGVASAKTPTLTIGAAASMDGYKYRCAVTNPSGTTYSAAATLTVYANPKANITYNPVDAVANEGGGATFSVRATGTGISYQWQALVPGSANWVNSGAATAKTNTLKITASASMNGYKYRCAVTNAGGTVYSNYATLTVRLKPDITVNPSNATVKAGNTATFQAAANGNGYELSYQWQVRAPGGNWGNSSLASAKTYSLSFPASTAHNGNQYRCAISNVAGTVYTSAATLTVQAIPAPVIINEPADVYTQSGSVIALTVNAMGENMSYQWQVKTPDSGSWANSGLSTAKTNSLALTINTTHAGYQYRCRVSNPGGTVYSRAVSISVLGNSTVSLTSITLTNSASAPGGRVYADVYGNFTGIEYGIIEMRNIQTDDRFTIYMEMYDAACTNLWGYGDLGNISAGTYYIYEIWFVRPNGTASGYEGAGYDQASYAKLPESMYYKSVSVTTASGDTTAPTVSDYAYLIEDGRMVVGVWASDSYSGVDYATVCYYASDTGRYAYANCNTHSDDGTFVAGVMDFPGIGSYKLYYVRVYDNAGNYRTYYGPASSNTPQLSTDYTNRIINVT